MRPLSWATTSHPTSLRCWSLAWKKILATTSSTAQAAPLTMNCLLKWSSSKVTKGYWRLTCDQIYQWYSRQAFTRVKRTVSRILDFIFRAWRWCLKVTWNDPIFDNGRDRLHIYNLNLVLGWEEVGCMRTPSVLVCYSSLWLSPGAAIPWMPDTPAILPSCLPLPPIWWRESLQAGASSFSLSCFGGRHPLAAPTLQGNLVHGVQRLITALHGWLDII